MLGVRLRDVLGGFDHQQGFRQNTGIRGRLVAGIGKLLILRKPLADDLLGLRRGDQGENRIASSVDAPEPRMIASSECSRCLILVLPLPHDYPSSSLPLLPQRPAYGRLRFATP